jgi:hypothetical protein
MVLVHALHVYTCDVHSEGPTGVDIPMIFAGSRHQGLIGGVASLPERNCGFIC